MALWDDLFSFIGSNTEVLGNVAKAGATIYSSVSQQNANRRAAEIAQQAAQANINAIEEGNRQAQERYGQIRADTGPAVASLRTIALRPPEQLTPEQELALTDTRHETLTGLRGSGLRGSARATTAALKKADTNFRTAAIGQNRSRSDQAASQLANPYFSASSNAAGTAAGTGVRVGQVAGAAGQDQANLETANAALRGRAIADVASIVADATKKRESRVGQSDDRKDEEGKTL